MSDLWKDRAAYDAAKNSFPPEHQYQWWPPPWYLATWKELPLILLYWLAIGVAALVGAIALMFVLGMMVEGIGRHNEEHDRCMKRATNGYEIERCR